MGTPDTTAAGDVEAAQKADGHVTVEGTFNIGGQSHFCMEKHTAVAVPGEGDRCAI